MKAELAERIKTACKAVFETEIDVELSRPDEQFGDYATNVALGNDWGGLAGECCSPRPTPR